jgi:hypothetical protein
MYISLTIFLFRSGIAFYFHLFSSSGHCKAQKNNMCVYGHMSKKSNYFKKKNLLSAKPEIVIPVPESDISFSKFPVSHRLLKLLYDENMQFFYLLCFQFRQKASG